MMNNKKRKDEKGMKGKWRRFLLNNKGMGTVEMILIIVDILTAH